MKLLFLIIPFIFTACSNNETNFSAGVEKKEESQSMQNKCKTYLAEGYEIPLEGVQTGYGYGTKNIYYIQVHIKWEDKPINKSGLCILRQGRVSGFIPN